MKALKKGRRYTRVKPLPRGWISKEGAARQAEMNGPYQQGFAKLDLLLKDGWEFCPRESMRRFEEQKLARCEPRGAKGKRGPTGKPPKNKKPKG